MTERDIWVLGATGRIGRSVAARLAEQGVGPILVGRRRESLAALNADTAGDILVADGAESIADAIRQRRPAVVVNLVGNYSKTASALVDAVLPGGHYVDLAADLIAVSQLLDRHTEAEAGGSTLVTGAGFGVLATEAVVAALCADRQGPATSGSTRCRRSPRNPVSWARRSRPRSSRRSPEAGSATRTDDWSRPGWARTRKRSHCDGETVKSAGAPSAELVAAQRPVGRRRSP
jgi:NAD(P)-dependent dehydrogenase (short-subunit alcohol dehydrogenase family)